MALRDTTDGQLDLDQDAEIFFIATKSLDYIEEIVMAELASENQKIDSGECFVIDEAIGAGGKKYMVMLVPAE